MRLHAATAQAVAGRGAIPRALISAPPCWEARRFAYSVQELPEAGIACANIIAAFQCAEHFIAVDEPSEYDKVRRRFTRKPGKPR